MSWGSEWGREFGVRVWVGVIAIVFGALVLRAVPAFAAAPEAPNVLAPVEAKAGVTDFRGVLDPGKTGTPGTFEMLEYEFVYNASSTECEGGGVAPESPGLSLGGGEEEVLQSVEGLAADTEYTVCLRVMGAGGETVSSPATFTTAPQAPVLAAEAVSGVEASAVTVEAEITPEGAETTYMVEYGTSASYGQSASGPAPVGSDDSAHPVSTRITGLIAGATYHYRVVAISVAAPERVLGPDKTFTTPEVVTSTAESCPNAQRREEQPSGLELPDCRAYEMVSPAGTDGQEATGPSDPGPRAAVSGDAIAYTSKGAFADPHGANLENELLSRRGPEGWTTKDITPPFAPIKTETGSAYLALAFTPELTEGVASTNASLTAEAPTPSVEESALDHDLYLAILEAGTYKYIGETRYMPLGAATDLSRVAYGETGEVDEWVDGTTVSVGVNNEGVPVSASVGDAAHENTDGYDIDKDLWHAVSEDGSRVYFTSPGFAEVGGHAVEGVHRLYVRMNVGQPQSPLASPEVNGTGTLTDGSKAVSSLVAAAGTVNEAGTGSTELTVEETTVGQFRAGQSVSGLAFEPGTEITKISGASLTLSKPTIAHLGRHALISAEGPVPFASGQEISGDGIQPGTTIEAVGSGSLVLSKPAASSGNTVELRAGGECSVPADACTVDVSASQRERENPAGIQSARYWGASSDGSKVFFTSNADLTEDAYTGPSGNAANLYEYDLETGRLTDLSIDDEAEGAAVQGVVQISEEGQYVYFVADGALAGGASEQQCRGETEGEQTGTEPKEDNLGCNLYVSHEGGAPVFVAMVAANDYSDWGSANFGEAGPAVTTASVSPSGEYLAFMSEKSLTGYDNQQAKPGDCAGAIPETANQYGSGACREVYLYSAATDGLVCASCDPSGARPVGPSGLRGQFGFPFAQHRPRNVLNDGVLFFDSSDALVGNNGGGQQNVYEYEDGRVYALSDVAGGHQSFFMDASADGSNVFFATSDALLPQASGQATVVYDARVDGGFPVPAASAPCSSGDTCKPLQTPQPEIFGPAPTATFSGPGNLTPALVTPKRKTVAQVRAEHLLRALKACRKKRSGHKRAVCEKSARKAYGAKAGAKNSSEAKRSSRANSRRRAK